MADSKPLISVVVPVYKVEKYIAQCIESITGQSYHEIEILLVDDGSPDSSGAICDEYAKKDPRIKVFHCPNRGVSCARNTGLSNASGSLVSFIDPDDFIDSDFLDYLYTVMTSGTGCADIAYCGFRRVDEEGKFLSEPRDTNASHIETFSTEEALINCLRARKDFQMFIWNGLFRKDVLPRFIEGRTIGQDQDFTIAALIRAGKVNRGWGVKYSYRVRGTGSKSLNLRDRMHYQYLALDDIRHHLENANADSQIMDAYCERCFRMDIGLMERYATGTEKDKDLFKALKSRMKDNARKTYKGLKGQMLAFILGAGEPFYRIIFTTIKKHRK